MRNARDHVAPLTSLRFLAALWVLLHHALPRGSAPETWRAELAAAGWLGVSLFFVLSGFLLTVRYAPLGALQVTKRRFWGERVARLAPTYLLAMLFALPLFVRDARVAGLDGPAIGTIATAAMTLQQSWRPEWACAWNCPAWSLSVEMWFYLAFPALVAALGSVTFGSRGRSGVLLTACLVAPFVIFPTLEDATSGWIIPVHSLSPLARWPEFVAGIALAGLLRDIEPVRARSAHGVLGLGVLWIAVSVASRPWIEAAGGHLLPVALPGFVLVIAGAWLLRDGPRGPLSHPGLVRLGDASYALYLLHGPLHSYLLAAVNRTVGRGHDTSWWVFGVYLVLALASALWVYSAFERPSRTRVRRWLGLAPAT